MFLRGFLKNNWSIIEIVMDKLKSDIEIIDWLNSLEWIEEVRVSPIEIVGKIDSVTTSMDKQDFNLINSRMDNSYYILFDSRLICIERFNV